MEWAAVDHLHEGIPDILILQRTSRHAWEDDLGEEISEEGDSDDDLEYAYLDDQLRQVFEESGDEECERFLTPSLPKRTFSRPHTIKTEYKNCLFQDYKHSRKNTLISITLIITSLSPSLSFFWSITFHFHLFPAFHFPLKCCLLMF